MRTYVGSGRTATWQTATMPWMAASQIDACSHALAKSEYANTFYDIAVNKLSFVIWSRYIGRANTLAGARGLGCSDLNHVFRNRSSSLDAFITSRWPHSRKEYATELPGVASCVCVVVNLYSHSECMQHVSRNHAGTGKQPKKKIIKK